MNKRALGLKLAILENFRCQADFAMHVGCHESLVSAVINGRRTLGDKENRRWAKALGRRLDELFEREK